MGPPRPIEQVIGDFARESNGSLMVLPDTTTTSHRELLVRLAAHYALPAVYPFRFFADAGGLASYGIDVLHVFRVRPPTSTGFCGVRSPATCRCKRRASSN